MLNGFGVAAQTESLRTGMARNGAANEKSAREFMSHGYASAQRQGSKAISLSEFGETRSHAMSKRQRGNKETKKPKQLAPAMKPLVPGDAGPTLSVVVPDRLKRK